MYKAYLDSPLGVLEIISSGKGITRLGFVKKKKTSSYNKALSECRKQLVEYFKGKRKKFSVPLDVSGSDFEEKTWRELKRIPYGKTRSYKEIALRVNNNAASRAIGNANGKNCVPIIIPCHRVISNNGSLGGYSSGLWRKKWLLVHEKKFL